LLLQLQSQLPPLSLSPTTLIAVAIALFVAVAIFAQHPCLIPGFAALRWPGPVEKGQKNWQIW
jgi:hypothetical protein